jgi:hypothetical protein
MKNKESFYQNLSDLNLTSLLRNSQRLPMSINCNFNLINNKRKIIEIESGQINIDKVVASSVAGIFLLRFGLEWQIWHKASKRSSSLPMQVVSLASFVVAVRYLHLLPCKIQNEVLLSLPIEFSNLVKCIPKDSPLEIHRFMDEDLGFLESLINEEGPRNIETYRSYNNLALIDSLAYPTEYFFIMGGDDRLRILDHTDLNKYGCLPFPRINTYTFSSSTATSVSHFSYNESEDMRQRCIDSIVGGMDSEYLHQWYNKTCDEIGEIFAIESTHRTIVFPSGTDAQLISSVLIGSDSENWTSVIVASDETGSGSQLAASGKHFDSTTCMGDKVQKGEFVSGKAKIKLREITQKNLIGNFKTIEEIDRDTKRIVDEEINAGHKVILHFMDQSKMGNRAPSRKLLEDLKNLYSNKFEVIVDACQTRADREDYQFYQRNGFTLLVTGSKFFTGPAFSGATIIRKELYNRFPLQEATQIELSPYNIKRGFLDCGHSRKSLISVLLRWHAAIVEAKRYQAVPLAVRQLGLKLFCDRVKNIINQSDMLSLLINTKEDELSFQESLGGELSARRTIFPFCLIHSDRFLEEESVRKVYELLNSDISYFFTSDSEESRLASKKCHIGQPVLYNVGKQKCAALRISAGARIISESWGARDLGVFFDRVESQLNQVELIVQKIRLILTSGILEKIQDAEVICDE